MIELGNDKKKFFTTVTESLAAQFIEDEKNGLCKYTSKAAVIKHVSLPAGVHAHRAMEQRGWVYTRAKYAPLDMSRYAIIKRVHEIVHENWEKQNANV